MQAGVGRLCIWRDMEHLIENAVTDGNMDSLWICGQTIATKSDIFVTLHDINHK